MAMNCFMMNRRIHDGIAGAVVAVGSLLAATVDPLWIWVPGILGATMLQSAITGFCPVYFVLDRLNKECSTADAKDTTPTPADQPTP